MAQVYDQESEVSRHARERGVEAESDFVTNTIGRLLKEESLSIFGRLPVETDGKRQYYKLCGNKTQS